MKDKIEICRLCEKEMKTSLIKLGTGSKKGRIESDEGVFFESWFCNKCWEEVSGIKLNEKFKIKKGKVTQRKQKVSIREIKKEVEKAPICIIEVNENIRRVFKNKPLTRSLASLNQSCEFRKRYNLAFDLINRDKIEETQNKYKKGISELPEEKEKLRKYHEKYYNNPKNKKRIKAYQKKPEIIAKRKEYAKKPERIAKMKEYEKRPKVVAKRKKYYEKNKDRLKKYNNERYRKKHNIPKEKRRTK